MSEQAETKEKGMPVSCQCGNVRFETPLPKPLGVAHCHCTECQKQSASAFGTSAYFPRESFLPLAPEIAERVALWTRPASNGGTMHCYFCPRCGVRLFHVIYGADGEPRDVVSIKGGCIEGLDISGAYHIFTRSAVFPIPEAATCYDTMPGVPQSGKD